jgi:hypothetical protein
MSNLPAIPDFLDDLQSQGATLRAMKQAVEIIGGQRQGQSLGAPQMFIQPNEPVQSRLTSFKRGDQWINDETDQMYYWTGQQWKQLV